MEELVEGMAVVEGMEGVEVMEVEERVEGIAVEEADLISYGCRPLSVIYNFIDDLIIIWKEEEERRSSSSKKGKLSILSVYIYYFSNTMFVASYHSHSQLMIFRKYSRE